MKNRYIKLAGNYQETDKDSYKYIKDRVTKLIWQRETLKLMRWDRARASAKNGWRVPTIQELESIRDLDKHYPCCDSIFESEPYWYWSSSPYAANNDDAWSVYFVYGYVLSLNKYDYGHVRLVRGKNKLLGALPK